MNLCIELKNCFGIGKLTESISYTDDVHTAVIYAPNGTMKTSLTKTFQRIIDKKQPTDELYPERESSSQITIDGNPINKENVYIFANEDKDGSSNISTFLANEELKKKYDNIFTKLTPQKTALKNKVKEIAHSSDCESEILETFKKSQTDTYLDCLLYIKEELDNNEACISDLDFKYNDLFDTGKKVKAFVDENKEDLQEYFSKYQDLVNESKIFTTGRNSFGTNQATTLLKSVDDDRFFSASHKMVLNNQHEIKSKKDMETIIIEEKNRIFQDPNLKSLFEKIEKRLIANLDLRGFKDVLISYPELVPELADYDELCKKVLRGYMKASGNIFTDLVALYEEKKDELKEIISLASEQHSQWEQIIDMFNSRFFVPFTLELTNKADVLLGGSVSPELSFIYKDETNNPKKKERKDLVEHLSRGEQKAFYILQNIFEIEARKTKGTNTLIVFDDVADSFDYKNKYAIIEYLSDIAKNEHFFLFILTHNFDFYRTVVSRIDVKNNSIFFAHKQKDRSVSFKQGIFKPDILKNRFINKIDKKRSFIGSIPFVRNILEYTKGTEDPGYLKLTSCLHLKDDTEAIKMKDIFSIIQGTISATTSKTISFSDEKYLICLFNEAEAILTESNEVEIADKLVLSMAIRLKAETYVKSILTPEQISEINANKNQTGQLIEIFKKYHNTDLESQCILLGRVLMLTSENIHLNNFMFEPLVDISILYLSDLYKECKNSLL